MCGGGRCPSISVTLTARSPSPTTRICSNGIPRPCSLMLVDDLKTQHHGLPGIYLCYNCHLAEMILGSD